MLKNDFIKRVLVIAVASAVFLVLSHELQKKDDYETLVRGDGFNLLSYVEKETERGAYTHAGKDSVSEYDLVSWARYVFPKIYEYSYGNAHDNIIALKEYFSPEGWKSYVEAIIRAQVPEYMDSRRLKLHVKVLARPTLVEYKLKDGADVWRLVAPVEKVFEPTAQSSDNIAPISVPGDMNMFVVNKKSENGKNQFKIKQVVTFPK